MGENRFFNKREGKIFKSWLFSDESSYSAYSLEFPEGRIIGISTPPIASNFYGFGDDPAKYAFSAMDEIEEPIILTLRDNIQEEWDW